MKQQWQRNREYGNLQFEEHTPIERGSGELQLPRLVHCLDRAERAAAALDRAVELVRSWDEPVVAAVEASALIPYAAHLAAAVYDELAFAFRFEARVPAADSIATDDEIRCNFGREYRTDPILSANFCLGGNLATNPYGSVDPTPHSE